MKHLGKADVCLILEGTYPYVFGGVSSWVQDLLLAQPHLNFHLWMLLPPDVDRTVRYPIPENVVGMSEVVIQQLPKGRKFQKRDEDLLKQLLEPALNIIGDGGFDDLRLFIHHMVIGREEKLGRDVLLNSRAAWRMILQLYNHDYKHTSFIDFFWSVRSLFSGLYSLLMTEMPKATIYHAVSTGYAGLGLVRAHVESGAATLLTEHGIYTNERRIEISMADWLYEDRLINNLTIDPDYTSLKNLWTHTFHSFARACYRAADQVITLYHGNQLFQIDGGAEPEKMRIIPNGIDSERFGGYIHPLRKDRHTIALVGRVVPIKDVKTYIRSCARILKTVPHLRALICGPTDEDPDYYQECLLMVRQMKLESCIEFTGKISIESIIDKVDLILLTSLSEAQPLVILEFGLVGIPSVTTDVGACREMIAGASSESPPLGLGGDVVPLGSPKLTAEAVVFLLSDDDHYRRCASAIQQRVLQYYNKQTLDETYRALYQQLLEEKA